MPKPDSSERWRPRHAQKGVQFCPERPPRGQRGKHALGLGAAHRPNVGEEFENKLAVIDKEFRVTTGVGEGLIDHIDYAVKLIGLDHVGKRPISTAVAV